MSVPTVYRWDDASAPQLTDYRDYSQIKALIQAVFVDGYGAKPGLGWSMQSTDAQEEINLTQADIGTGVRGFLRLDYTVRVTNGYHRDNPRFYENNAGSGINLINNDSETTSCTNIGGWNDDQTKVIPWMIIGTSRCFYSFFGYNGVVAHPTIPTDFTTNGYIPHSFVGDFVPSVDILPYNQCAAVHPDALLSSSTVSSSATATSRSYAISRSTADVGCYIETIRDQYKNVGYSKNTPLQGAMGALGNHLGVRQYPLTYPYPDGGLYMEEVYFLNRNSGMIWGKLPGMYTSLHDRPLRPSSGVSTFDGTGVHAGKTFVCVSASAGGFEWYFDITSDWGV